MVNSHPRTPSGRRSIVAGVFLLSTVVSLAVAGHVNAEPDFVAAGPTDDTYQLSNLAILFPYEPQDIGAVVTYDGSKTYAGVTFDIAWSGDAFPGDVYCRFDLFDSKGNLVGSAVKGFAAAESGSAAPVPAAVAVTGTPSDPQAVCSAGAPAADGAAYELTNPAVVEDESGVSIVADVTWATDEPPLLADCSAVLDVNGVSQTWEFSLGAPEAQGIAVTSLPDNYANAKVESIGCQPLQKSG